MGTKNNPGEWDCYEAADPDEPMFVLLGRDPLAPILVRIWVFLRVLTRGMSVKTDEAWRCARDMGRWREGGSRGEKVSVDSREDSR